MSRVEELLIERSTSSIIEIGQILQKFYNGQAGAVFRAIVNGHIKDQISQLQDNGTSAERRLGRAEGVQLVQDSIELAIAQMESLTTPQESE